MSRLKSWHEQSLFYILTRECLFFDQIEHHKLLNNPKKESNKTFHF